MKLGGALYKVQTSRPCSTLGVRNPKNVALGYDVGKISAGCLADIRSSICKILNRVIEWAQCSARHI